VLCSWPLYIMLMLEVRVSFNFRVGAMVKRFYSGSSAGFLSSTRERSCAIAASMSMPTS
jgi:hypothetical protein